MTVDLDQTYGTALVPCFARKFVGDEINLVQTEQWSSTTEARSRSPSPASPAR